MNLQQTPGGILSLFGIISLLGSSLNFKITTDSGSLNISESKSHHFQFFDQNQRTVHFHYFKNFKESPIFMKELAKNRQRTVNSLAGFFTFFFRELQFIPKLVL
jgi:hypothetical protein